jgi:hypothetical protein
MLLGSDILETVLALFSVFFLGSVVVSQINEGVAGLLSQRSKQLEFSLRELLIGPQASAEEVQFFQDFITNPLFSTLKSSYVRRKLRSKPTKVLLPSYIPAKTFAEALLSEIYIHYIKQCANCDPTDKTAIAVTQQTDESDLYQLPRDITLLRQAIVKTNLVPVRLKRTLLTTINKDVTSVQMAVVQVANWYDQKMARVSGAYKRWAQQMILIWSLLIVVFLNFDSINILSALSHNEALRQKVAALQAANSAVAPVITSTTTISNPTIISNTTDLYNAANLSKDLENVGLPLGPTGWGDFWNKTPNGWDYLLKVIGLLVSIIAISLGAPFWFDVLNKISNLRSSGANPTSPATVTALVNTSQQTTQPTTAITPNQNNADSNPAMPAATTNTTSNTVKQVTVSATTGEPDKNLTNSVLAEAASNTAPPTVVAVNPIIQTSTPPKE